MKADGADEASEESSNVKPATPSWLAELDEDAVDVRKVVIGRVVVGLVGLGLWWAEVPTRWIIWTWGSLLPSVDTQNRPLMAGRPAMAV